MLEGTLGNKEQLTQEEHAKIAARTTLMLQVGKLLQDGGFGDSSDEEADEDASDAAGSRLRRKVAPTAKSQPSDTPAAPPPPEPLASQARAFMAERAFLKHGRRRRKGGVAVLKK